MKKYDNYKDSGIEWIGKIPSQWSCTKLKFHTKKIIDGAHFTPTYIEKSNESIPFLRVTDLHSKEILLDEVKYIPLTEHQELIKRCNPEMGDLLLSKNGTIGLMKIIDWDWEFSIFVSLCLLKFENSLLNKFFYYFFESNIVDRQLFESSQKTSVSNLHLEKIKELRLTLPPIEEQTQIANYLDHKTTQIDILISKKQQFISLLQEERIAVINQAVTKGLDPKVKMKDSGIEWLGEIPEHWKITRLANFGEFLKGRGITKADLTEDGISVVLYGDIYTKYNIKTEKLERKTSIENAKNAIQIFNGDLLFTASGETKEDIGKCIVFTGNEESVASGDVIIFRQNSNDSLFLGYVFNSYNVVIQKARLSKGEIVVHIYSSQLRNIHFALPPLSEQIDIRNYIDSKTEDILNIITKTQQEIELLKEYKTALISEVVTGKVDVREEILN